MNRNHKLRLVILAIASIWLVQPAAAITDIDSIRMSAPEDDDFVGETSLQAAGSGGNSENTTITVKNNMVWLQTASEYMVLLSYRYGQSFDVNNANEGFLHLRHSRDINALADRWENYIQADTNEFRRLKERSLIGSNLRWRLREKEDSIVSFALGAFLFRERLNVEEAYLQQDEGVRMNLHLVYTVELLKATALSLGAYYQPKVGEWSNAQALMNLSIESPIADRFATTVDVQYRFDSHPPPDVVNYDISYTVGIKYLY